MQSTHRIGWSLNGTRSLSTVYIGVVFNSLEVFNLHCHSLDSWKKNRKKNPWNVMSFCCRFYPSHWRVFLWMQTKRMHNLHGGVVRLCLQMEQLQTKLELLNRRIEKEEETVRRLQECLDRADGTYEKVSLCSDIVCWGVPMLLMKRSSIQASLLVGIHTMQLLYFIQRTTSWGIIEVKFHFALKEPAGWSLIEYSGILAYGDT